MRRGVRFHFLVTSILVAVLLALPGASSIELTQTGGAIHPIRKSNGNAKRTVKNQVVTSNWSGYALAKYNTGQSYTSASATWTVPNVLSAPGTSTSYSSSWVGIGGFCLNAKCSRVDKTLIQLGTEQNASSSGATQYYAWYETLPKPPTTITSLTVSPGDTIVATLADGPTIRETKPSGKGGKSGSSGPKGQNWTLTMKDVTTGISWSTSISYDSSLASAEWIEEAPYSGGVLPLADFGTVNFDHGFANSKSPDLSSTNGIVMSDPNGQTSNISSPDSDFDGFNACWGNGNSFASCPVPSS